MSIIPLKQRAFSEYMLWIYIDIFVPKIDKARQYFFETGQSPHSAGVNHISIIQAPVREIDIPEIKENILRFKTPSFSIEFNNTVVIEDSGFISIPVTDNRLIELHRELINITRNFTTRVLREKDYKKLDKFNDIELTALTNYGYIRSGDNFAAHMTIGEAPTKESLHQAAPILNRFNGERIQHAITSLTIVLYKQSQNIPHTLIYKKTLRLAPLKP